MSSIFIFIDFPSYLTFYLTICVEIMPSIQPNIKIFSISRMSVSLNLTVLIYLILITAFMHGNRVNFGLIEEEKRKKASQSKREKTKRPHPTPANSLYRDDKMNKNMHKRDLAGQSEQNINLRCGKY